MEDFPLNLASSGSNSIKIYMIKLLQRFILFAVCLSLLNAATCPAGSIVVSSFASVTGDQFASPSGFYDALYEIKVNKTLNTYTLIGYRLSEVETATSASFNVVSFSLGGKESWKIVAVSYLGNCVVVEDGPALLAFTTTQNVFATMQNIMPGAYSSVIVNQDCSLLRVKTIDGTQKVYQNSVINTNFAFPSDAMFDSYHIYGIDSSKLVKKVTSTGISSFNLGVGTIQDTPISIMNRVDLKALIIVSKVAATNQYTVTIASTLTEKKVYSKSWTNTAYTSNFIADVSSQGAFVLVRHSGGFLQLLKMDLLTTGLQVTEITLDKPIFSPLFVDAAVVSFTSTGLVTYLSGKLTYFQPVAKLLYFSSQISADLEQLALQYETLGSKQAPLIPTIVEPSQIVTCTIKATNNNAAKSENQVTQAMVNQDISVALDENGNTMKCASECLSCTTGGYCEVCALGYSLSDAGTCILCSGCRSCLPSTPSVCISCFNPEVLNPTTNLCEKPKCSDTYCLSCQTNGTCKECHKGYSVYNGVCVKCQDGCPSCVNSGADSCDITVSSCKLGFVYSPHTSRNVNYSCAQCATGCTSCSLTDISNCTSCNEGFYASLNSQTNVLRCSLCMQNCRSCSNQNTCDRCLSGFRLNSDNTKCIEKCNSNCLTCSETNTSQCLSCYAGSFLENSKCSADLSCNPSKNCTACGDGYALQGGECLKCNLTDPNCQSCAQNDLNTCFKCAFGYYLDTSRSCVKCSSSCTGCLSNDVCYSCADGYYLAKTDDSVTGKCLACISQCQTCNQFPYLCTSCKSGFVLDGSKCISEVHLDYTLTINAPVEQMVSLGRTFLSVLVDFAAKNSVDSSIPLTLTEYDVTINKLKTGSTVTSGLISTYTKAQSDVMANKISSIVGSQLENGYSIIAVQSNTVTPEDNNTNPTTTSSSSSGPNLAILLGVLIPVIIIIIVAAIILTIWCLRKRRGSSDSGPSSKEDYLVNDSSKTINRTSEHLDKL